MSGKKDKSSGRSTPEIRVEMLAKKGGRERACVRTGSSAQKAVSLDEFSEPIRAALSGKPTGTYVVCEWTASPSPQALAIAAGAQAVVPSPPAPQPAPVKKGTHASAAALPASSPLDDANPFNFVEWDGDGPVAADDPLKGQHDQWYDAASSAGTSQRFSGAIEVTLRARSPIFVPQGTPDDQPPPPHPFWSCADSTGAERFGLPGSSVKGALRVLYEAWTNSRLGVVSTPWYEAPIPYRRRTATAWVVKQLRADCGLDLVGCELEFVRFERRPDGTLAWFRRTGANGQREAWNEAPSEWQTQAPTPTAKVNLSVPSWQALAFRANLFWVPRAEHRHDNWKLVAVRLKTGTATAAKELVAAYRANLQHESFREHWQHVKDLEPAKGGGGAGARSFYTGMDKPTALKLSADARDARSTRQYERSLRDLEDLTPGCLLFGLTESPSSNRVVCFGKNVNFLWPSRNSPKTLSQAFQPRDRLELAEADWTESAFGFAAEHGRGDSSHPFRGRVRFGTFWAPANARPMEPVSIRQLLSPSGVKLKARTVYLPARGVADPRAATYDEATRLRGRKLYWHQGRRLAEVPASHRGDPANGDDPLIRPLPADTPFTGCVHFDNLTRAELGVLLVCLCPDLYWPGNAEFGWKIGKGKPRALGSVHVRREDLTLAIRRAPAEAYASLAEPLLAPSPPDEFVTAFAAVVPPTLGRVGDLRALLRLPKADRPRSYVAIGGNSPYGWMPGFDKPTGDPNGQRPAAMRRARDLDQS